MTSLLDGPAAGVTLALRRAPLFLRVVHLPAATDPWDGLDQLRDLPSDGERLYAYRRQGKARAMHLRISSKNKANGWYAIAEYKVVDPQPDAATMRDTAAWRAWASEQYAREKSA